MKHVFAFIALFVALNSFAQQKAMYTQYMFNTLAINPAYSTLDESMTITALSRHQWVGFKGAPNIQTLSLHTPIGESNTFIGGILVNDQIGEVIRETGGDISLAQRVAIGTDSYFSVGVNAGSSNLGANYSENFKQSPASVSDPVFQDMNGMRVNFGWGAMLFSDKYYVGISAPHFFYRDLGSLAKSANKTAYRPHYILQAGYLIDLNENVKFKPNFLIKYVNGSPTQFDINANFLLNQKVWLGASYRSLDSFDALLSVFLTPDLQVGYSYDFTNTALAKAQKGSHEIALKFRLPVRGRDHTACYF